MAFFQLCTSFRVVSLYIPPGFTKQRQKKKEKKGEHCAQAGSQLMKDVNAFLYCSTTETSQNQGLNDGGG